MNGLWQHFSISLRLYFRNRMALLYGYLFPLIFLVALWMLYRHERVPLLGHLGELLTVSVLGSACFGLPTTLVSERECGVWRRYRLAPWPPWMLVASLMLVRYVIVVSAGVLQLGAALAVGMTFPAHPLGLFVAFTGVAFAFIGLGLVIAMLADNVPAVQALGQCVFLPMLIIGGVAVPLAALPVWAQHVSAFFPGRYAVEVLQAAVTGPGLDGVCFSLLALGLIGLAAFSIGAKWFRWDAASRFANRSDKGWLGAVFGAWLVVGLLAEWRGPVVAVAAPVASPTVERAPRSSLSWNGITAQDVASLDFNVPPDGGVVTPFASAGDQPEDFVREQLALIRDNLPVWPPANEGDLVGQVRACLAACAIADTLQSPVEAYLPQVVLDHLSTRHPRAELVQLLTWIALHPGEGPARVEATDLGIEGTAGDARVVRERAYYYAIKFIARLTGRVPQG
jgi:ABC-2 type transport system permease protein